MFPQSVSASVSDAMPSSSAERAPASAMAMFVGLVRSAPDAGGESCTLSGGRWCDAAVQFSRKYRQISAARRRRNSRSPLSSGFSFFSLLSRWAMSGVNIQQTAAARPANVCEKASSSPEKYTTGHIAANVPARSALRRSLCSAVCHWSSRRCETPIRQSASTIAETLVHASAARKSARAKTRVSSPPRPCSAALLKRTSRPSRKRTLRPYRSTGRKRTSSAQSAGRRVTAFGKRNHAPSAAKRPTGSSARRRESKSRQRSMGGSALPRRKSHGRFCTSPRIQRCARAK